MGEQEHEHSYHRESTGYQVNWEALDKKEWETVNNPALDGPRHDHLTQRHPEIQHKKLEGLGLVKIHNQAHGDPEPRPRNREEAQVAQIPDLVRRPR